MKKINPRYIPNDKNDIISISRKVRFIVNSAIIILGLTFGYLKLRGISILPFINNLSGDFILKLSIVAYYFSWSTGTLSDINDMEIVYIRGPENKYLPPAYLIASIIVIVFALLCWVKNFQGFAIVLFIFCIINLFARTYLVKFILKNMFNDSQKEYQKINSFSLLEKLYIVQNYSEGNWQWIRFIIGLMLIIIVILLAFTPLSLLFSKYLKISSEVIDAFSVFLYVIFMETSIWIMRVKMKVSLSVIEKIDKKYHVKLTKKGKRVKSCNITDKIKSLI